MSQGSLREDDWFRNVEVPLPVSQLQPDESAVEWSQTSGDVETWFRGSWATNVRMELQAFREDYMIATAVSDPSIQLPCFQLSNIGEWIVPRSGLSA